MGVYGNIIEQHCTIKNILHMRQNVCIELQTNKIMAVSYITMLLLCNGAQNESYAELHAL